MDKLETGVFLEKCGDVYRIKRVKPRQQHGYYIAYLAEYWDSIVCDPSTWMWDMLPLLPHCQYLEFDSEEKALNAYALFKQAKIAKQEKHKNDFSRKID